MLLVWLVAGSVGFQIMEGALDEGIRRYWNGEYQATIEVLQPACTASAPSDESLECRKYLAFSHIALGDEPEAEHELTQLLSMDPGYRLDETLVSPKILQYFDRARSDLATAVYDEGKAAYRKGDLEGALERFERVLVLDATNELAAEYAELCRERMRVIQARAEAERPEPAPADTVPTPVAPEREDKVYRLTSEILRPQLVTRVTPEYPRTARVRRDEGAVVVSVVIDANGRITQPKVIRSVSEHLDRAALEALEKWRYEPARLNGLAVAVYSIIELSFVLNGS